MTGPAKDASGHYRFNRPMWRVGFDLLAAPLGAVLFGGFALVVITGAIPMPDLERLVFSGLIGFFALLLVVATFASWRRGFRRTILDVGPDGIWTPEMGYLPWSDVAELRRESYLSGAASRSRRSLLDRGTQVPVTGR